MASSSDDGSGPARAAQLRERIDRGGAGDKVSVSDPAAAPLGTDDEAAGTPPTMEQVERAARLETRAAMDDEKRTPEELQSGQPFARTAAFVAIAVALAVLVWWLFLR
ncbi:hypothetical protein [Oceaniglobus roseus]|uniref:hypothetical protein n=1 Tax=Oceaniglobus roseus TaxID=1737570 RepID=UPI000C7F59FD|nr:hypothetical protein [Kandeliimicrobium roseum]